MLGLAELMLLQTRNFQFLHVSKYADIVRITMNDETNRNNFLQESRHHICWLKSGSWETV